MKTKEVRNLDDHQLVEKVREFREELFNLRFRNSMRQLDNPLKIREGRREMARIGDLGPAQAAGLQRPIVQFEETARLYRLRRSGDPAPDRIGRGDRHLLFDDQAQERRETGRPTTVGQGPDQFPGTAQIAIRLGQPA